MINWLLIAWLVPLAMTGQAKSAGIGCADIKSDAFYYIGGQQPTMLASQKYLLKKFRGRMVAGIPIPGGSQGRPKYEVQVVRKPEPASVKESRPVFHISSKTPRERIVVIRLNPCGKNDCFNLYQDGPAAMAMVRLDSHELGTGCYELVPAESLNPGNYALAVFGEDLKPQLIARFVAGPELPEHPK
jgi:hypothetical protein